MKDIEERAKERVEEYEPCGMNQYNAYVDGYCDGAKSLHKLADEWDY